MLEARAALGIAIGEFYPQQQQGTGLLTYNRASQAGLSADPVPAELSQKIEKLKERVADLETKLDLPPKAPDNSRSTPPSPLKYYWLDSLGMQAAWELDFWGKFRRGVESADAVYLASIATYDDVLVTLLADVAATYIGIRTTEQQIEIAQANVRTQREALGIAQDKFRVGTATELDVFQATNVLEATQAAIPQLTIRLQQGLNALRVLLGMAPTPLGALTARARGKIPVPPSRVAVGIPADLLRRRPDIRAAELRAMAQSAQIGVATAQLLPAISITGTFGGLASTAHGHNLAEIFSSKGLTYAGGPAFQWNILNYGQITNNVRLQDATLQQYLIDYQNTVLKAQKEVEDGISSFVQSRAVVAFLRKSVDAAKGALKIATLEYQQGTRDFTAVLLAEQNLLQAENNLAVATGEVSLGLTAIFRALGGGWQIRNDSYFVWPATADEMRARTNWGGLLAPSGAPQPPAPGLPSPGDIGPTVRPPKW